MCFLIIYGAISIPENKGQSLVKTEDKMIGNNAKPEIYKNNAFENESTLWQFDLIENLSISWKWMIPSNKMYVKHVSVLVLNKRFSLMISNNNDKDA